jgi:hypothetical protein
VTLNLFIDTPDGKPAPAMGVIAQTAFIVVKPGEFIRLAPGATWRTGVAPMHMFRDDSRSANYAAAHANGPLDLSPGAYRLRLEAINYPGYGHQYDVATAPANTWEGKITANGSLEVEPLSATTERQLLDRYAAGQLSDAEFAVLTRNAGDATIDALIEDIRARPESGHRMWRALSTHLRPGVLSRIAPTLAQLPDAALSRMEADPAAASWWGPDAIDDRDCLAASQLVARSIRVLPFGALVERCEPVRSALHQLVMDEAQRPDRRGEALKLLGRSGHAEEIQLLEAMVLRPSPTPTAARFDHLLYGAVYALGASPAPEAERALIAALVSENARNVRSEILRALGQRRDRAAVPAITQVLSDPDPGVVSMALSALSQLDAASVQPSVLPLLRHQDTSVRQMASGFILKFGTRNRQM